MNGRRSVECTIISTCALGICCQDSLVLIGGEIANEIIHSKCESTDLSPYDVNTQCITVVVVTASAGLLCFLQDCAGVWSEGDIS